ncbi:MAG: sulfatase-like hydrolase/transferase, partial [Burkholderiales bacterium]|nr:sulfatase-like hydrolase/transferase [Burkholderiales bacterium]
MIRHLARAAAALLAACAALLAAPASAQGTPPNILVIMPDDVGYSNVAIYSHGMMVPTPNIDRIGREGRLFTDHYAHPSCTPGSPVGLDPRDPTLAKVLKPLGYATGQFGKNHLGDRNSHLPTVHGFDEFYGNLYHLNTEEEPEL